MNRLRRENEVTLREMAKWPRRERRKKLTQAGFSEQTMINVEVILTDFFGLRDDWEKTEEYKAIGRAEYPNKVENFFRWAPNTLKLAMYEQYKESSYKANFLQCQVAYILEMARRKGINLSLGAILRSSDLSWFNFPPIKDKQNMSESEREECINTKLDKGSDKKAVWDRRNLIILKALKKCGAKLFSEINS